MDRKEALRQLSEVRARRAVLDGSESFARLLDFDAAPYQLAMLRAVLQYVLVNCSRQAGKSTAAALLALHRALSKPRQFVLVFGAAGRQANEILEKVQDLLSRMPVRPDLKDNSRTAIRFQNGSRIVALPSRVPDGSTIRGPAPNLIIFDEAGFAPEGLFKAVLPMVIASRGQVFFLSTPNGPHSEERPNFFHRMWTFAEQSPKWLRIEAPWTEIPFIDKDEVETQRVMLGDLFPQEFECRFVRAGAGLVYAAFTRALNVVSEMPKVDGDVWSYQLSIDPSAAGFTGYSVGAWREHDPIFYVVHSASEKGTAPTDVANSVEQIQSNWPIAGIVIDTSGLGKGYEQELLKYKGIWAQPADKRFKASYIQSVNGLLATGWVKILASCTGLISQLESVVWDRTRMNYASGSVADEADAFLYGARMSMAYLEEPRQKPMTEAERIRKETEAIFERAERNRRYDQDPLGHRFGGIDLMDGIEDPWGGFGD